MYDKIQFTEKITGGVQMKLKLIKLLAAMGILGTLAGCEKEEETINDVVSLTEPLEVIEHTPGGCASDFPKMAIDRGNTGRPATKDVGTPKK